ncbi:MAG: glycosyltransferase [Chitinivibrionales bacterium]|nr:glycosyltransferase [Chitinivibrionales bacterium]
MPDIFRLFVNFRSTWHGSNRSLKKIHAVYQELYQIVTGPQKEILLINWRDIKNPEAGGAEVYYHEIFKRLAGNQMYRVTVLSHAWRGAARTEQVDTTTVIRIGSKHLFNFSVFFWVRTHQAEYDCIIEDLNKVPFFTPLYTTRPRLHLVMHFFGASIFKETGFPMAFYIWFMEKLVPAAYKNEQFVAISQSTGNEIRKFSKNPDRIDIIEPGIDTKAFYPSCKKSESPLLVYIGRIKKYKNAQFMIRCLPAIRKEFPSAKLVIAGAGDYLSPLKNLANRLGLNNAVDFPGFISETEKQDLLSSATLKINPSIKEGWGITNVEANLCGTISISSNVPGLCDSVKDGVTGLLFRYNDPDDFLEKVLRTLKNPSLRAEMEKSATAWAKEFAWDGIAERMNAVLKKIV